MFSFFSKHTMLNNSNKKMVNARQLFPLLLAAWCLCSCSMDGRRNDRFNFLLGKKYLATYRIICCDKMRILWAFIFKYELFCRVSRGEIFEMLDLKKIILCDGLKHILNLQDFEFLKSFSYKLKFLSWNLHSLGHQTYTILW